MAYSYLTQSIQSTCLIEPKDMDSFYYPVANSHTGFAWDGTLYSAGVQQPGPTYASWYNEGANTYRGYLQTFPQTGLILLSKAALTILDGSTTALNLWMQFLLGDQYGLPDNFNSSLNGWVPTGLVYANGILSAICTPDAGNLVEVLLSPPLSSPPLYNVDSTMIISLDFTQDKIYLDVAV
jgi:hypothetical protein